ANWSKPAAAKRGSRKGAGFAPGSAAKLAGPRKTLGGHAAGGRTAAQPLRQFLPAAREGAVSRILPGESVRHREGLQVAHPAILVALQAYALAARHLRHLGHREHQKLAIFADDGDMV